MKTTLLITTYNRGNLLRNSLRRLEHLTLPDEILVVDDGGTDNTEQIIKDFEGKMPIRYIYNHNPEWSICSFARNIGVKEATGDLIITSEPEMLWISDIVPIILEERKKYPLELISASIIYKAHQETPWNEGFITKPEEALKDSIVEDYQIQPRSYHPQGFCRTTGLQATYIASYEKEWLMEINGWDEEFPGCWGWDDIDLATRLRVNGINQHICKKLIAMHQWHPAPPQEKWMRDSHLNEMHFKNKNIQDKQSPFIVANKNKEWGVVTPRP